MSLFSRTDYLSISLRNKYIEHSDDFAAPHIYAISKAAFVNMKMNERSQTILVGGESGSGKTESVKILLNHFSHLSSLSNSKFLDLVSILVFLPIVVDLIAF
jgi:myosin heavy subunit